MRKFLFVLTILAASLLSSCWNNEEPASSPAVNYTPPPEEPHNQVEIVNSGDVEVTDYVPDDNEEFAPNQAQEAQLEENEESEVFEEDSQLSDPARQRMDMLMNDSDYQRNGNKLKRTKIAHRLNREGYRKSDGSRFRRRDIPKNQPD